MNEIARTEWVPIETLHAGNCHRNSIPVIEILKKNIYERH